MPVTAEKALVAQIFAWFVIYSICSIEAEVAPKDHFPYEKFDSNASIQDFTIHVGLKSIRRHSHLTPETCRYFGGYCAF